MDNMKNIEGANLSEKDLENVTGGAKAGLNDVINYITVACAKCGEHLRITSNTKIRICTCGYKNTYDG